MSETSHRHLPPYESDAGVQLPVLAPDYRSSVTRAPQRPLTVMPGTLTELTGPLLGNHGVAPDDHDLTRQHGGDPQGERIVVHGRLLDGYGRAVPDALIELWQANAAGRYRHTGDRHDAPLDPNFTGVGRTTTDKEGRYRFVTIKPGAYPWRNHTNAWRPAHIHFSLFGRAFVQRLITQMYFPGDQLLEQDPIFQAIHNRAARDRLVARLDLDATVPEWALAYRFDIVLRGRDSTAFENEENDG